MANMKTDFEKRNRISPVPAHRELGESYIYLVSCGTVTKIGFSSDPEKRMLQMQGGNPIELIMLKAWLVTSPEIIEECLHAQFEKYHVRGEWFNIPSSELLELVALPSLASYLP